MGAVNAILVRSRELLKQLGWGLMVCDGAARPEAAITFFKMI